MTRCYVQHFLSPYIDSEVNHERHFIKIPFINKFMDFIYLHSICDQRFVGAARFCGKWGIKLVQATLIPLARSYFPLNCEQADRQIFGLSVKLGLIIGHRNTSLLMSIS